MFSAASTCSQIQPSGLGWIVLGGLQWPVATSEVVKGVKVICIHVWTQYLHCVIWLTGRPNSFPPEHSERRTDRQRGWLVLQAVVVAARVRHFLCPPQKPQKLQSAKGVKTDNSRIVGRNIRRRKCHERNWAVFLLSHRSSWQRAFIAVMYGVRQMFSTLRATLRGDAARTAAKILVTFERIILFLKNALQNLPLAWCVV